MFGSDFPKTNCYFRAVNIFFSAMRFNARYAVAAFVIIRNVLYVFGGDVSGFFAVEHNGKSGLPFKFFADKDYFRFFVIEGRVLPIQAAKNRLSAFPPVLKRNASNVRFEKFKRKFRFGCWRTLYRRAARGGSFNALFRRSSGRAVLRLLAFDETESRENGGDRNSGYARADVPFGKHRESRNKEQRRDDPHNNNRFFHAVTFPSR